MERQLMLERGLDRFNPLRKILSYDDFDRGFGGWMDLNPNFTGDDFRPPPSIVDKSR